VANMVNPELDYYAYSYHDSYYNQSQSEISSQEPTVKKERKKSLLEQFRRK
jgi:polysaccharide biosynthesis transport protein